MVRRVMHMRYANRIVILQTMDPSDATLGFRVLQEQRDSAWRMLAAECVDHLICDQAREAALAKRDDAIEELNMSNGALELALDECDALKRILNDEDPSTPADGAIPPPPNDAAMEYDDAWCEVVRAPVRGDAGLLVRVVAQLARTRRCIMDRCGPVAALSSEDLLVEAARCASRAAAIAAEQAERAGARSR